MRELIDVLTKAIQAKAATNCTATELKELANAAYDLSNAEENFRSVKREHSLWESMEELKKRLDKLESA